MPAVIVMLALAAPTDAELIEHASDAFAEGLRRMEAREKSRRQFLEAAHAYEQVSRRGPAVWRGIGNSYRLAGDLPRAILAYRLGLRQFPSSAALRKCLELAREEVQFEGPLGRPVDEAPPGWLAGERFLLAALGWVAACLALMRYYMTRLREWLVTGVVALAAAVGLAGWWLMEATRPGPLRVAVVAKKDGAQLLRGDGPLFAPRHPQWLYPGTEAVVHRERGEWRLIEVNGGLGWVPAEALVEEGE
jgi:hypothetical protein